MICSFYLIGWEFFNHKLILNFVKCFLWIYWDDHIMFYFYFINMVYHLYWFVFSKHLLFQGWRLLIMVYNPSTVLLHSVCIFFENFSIYIHELCFSFSYILPGIDIRIILVLKKWLLGDFPLWFFFFKFEKERHPFFFIGLV